VRSRKALVVMVLVGVVSALLVAGTTFAQTAPTAEQQGKTGYQEFFLDRLASLLGVSRDSLDGALKHARDDTADQALQDGRITQEQAERIKAREGFWSGPGFIGPKRGDAGRTAVGAGIRSLDVVSQALGMTSQELLAELRAGRTLADLISGREDAVRDALVAAAEARFAQAVAAGRMTQEQADRMLEQMRSFDLSQLGRLGSSGWSGMRGRPGAKEGMDRSGLRERMERFRELRPSSGSPGPRVSAL
jgi:hypothetical protein